MKTTIPKPTIPLPFAAILALSLASPLSWGAALTDNLPTAMWGTTPINISVTPGEEGFASAAGTGAINTPFYGSVLDYAFFTNTAAPYAAGTMGASRISNLTNLGSADNKTSLWETSSTADPADFTLKGVRSKAETGKGNGTTFTVDISGLTSGTVYVINGSWQARSDWLTVSMTGTGQTPVTTDSGNGDGDGDSATFGFSPAVGGISYFTKRIDFSAAADYDTITFVVHESGSQDGYFSGVVLTDGIAGDTTPPSPATMTWATPPAADSENAISMTATTATDASIYPVQYLFTETTGNPGATSSGWQSSPSYTDSGLTANTTYSYTVQAKDAFGNTNNVSTPSADATTDVADTTAPPTPTFVSPLGPVTHTAITMTANAVTDPEGNGVEYRFLETSGNPGATSSGWLSSPTYTDTGLSSGTEYSYTVQARDTSPGLNTSPASAAEPATTLTDSQAPPTPAFDSLVVSYNSITLTAVAVTDPEGNGVQYLFTNVTNTTDSGWQSSPTYTDTGLTPETLYNYTVTARDTAPTPNESAASAESPATTLAAPTGTLTDVSTVAAGGNSLISVTPGQFQGYSANTGTVDTAFNAAVLDYGFYNRNPAFGDSLGGSSRISTLTNPQGGNDYTDYWITSDPLTQPADQTNSGSRTGTSAQGLTSGAIDISGLTSGTLYIFHGRWQAGSTDYLAVTMSGSGVTSAILPTAGTTTTGAPLMWATRIDFSDPSDDYDTITFTHLVNDGAGDGYLSATVLTGTGGGGGSAYSDWASTNAPTTGNDAAADEDADGVSNGLEFVLGGTISTNDLDKLPALSTSSGNLLFAFQRDQDSIDAAVSLEIEVGTDLATWPASYTVGATTGTSDAGVTVSQDDPGLGTDTVTLSVPQAPDAKKFARLKVVITP